MEILQFIHSYWAYLVLVVLILATLNALIKFFGNKEFEARDFRISLFALITMHIQLLIGIILYFTKDYFSVIDEVGGMGEVMKNADLRNLIVEHPTTMIIAVALVTIGYSKHKKKLVSKPKFKLLSIFYTLALILVLAKIPWNLWF
jgi:heme A synthase